MKKYLLILCVVIVASANAQKLRTIASEKVAKPVVKNKVYQEVDKPLSIPSTKAPVKHSNPANHVTNVCTGNINVIQIGSAGNAFGSAFGPRTNLWYDKDLNTVSFTHRSTPGVNGSTTTGDIRYDYSTDGGVTWPAGNLDKGPAYKASGPQNNHLARYPNGVIYNPSGNTTPANAYQTVYGATTDGTDWIDHFKGTTPIGTTTNNQGVYSMCVMDAQIPEGFQVVKNTGTIWASSPGVSCAVQTVTYNGNIVLSKGIFSNGDVNYTFSNIAAPLEEYATHSMAWNDGGDIGYIAIIGNEDIVTYDSAYYIIVYKTTDGGTNWNKVGDKTNINIDVLDTLLNNNPGILCTTAFELDCAVDKNNNLHIAIGIGLSPGGFSIVTGPGDWGIFDIYTQDGGSTWYGELLCQPETFRGLFGVEGSTTDPDIGEDSRPQASRSWDGSKMSFTWFDTDTLVFGSGIDNQFCNMFSRSWDISSGYTGNWTPRCTDFTSGTVAEAFCTFGNVSYYSITNGTDECIPMVFGTLASTTQTGSPMSFSYVDGACISQSCYTVAPSPTYLSDLGVSQNPDKTIFNVSVNYPNPFNGLTYFDINLPKSSDVTVEISNIVGQVISTQTYKNLNAGKTQLTIDASNLASGLYIYKVKAGSDLMTRTMSVK